MDKKCVIVSAGDFVPVDLDLNDGDFLIACDAGFLNVQKLGLLPDLIIGDFDSLSETGSLGLSALREIEEADPSRVMRLDVMKDDTDTIKAVKVGFKPTKPTKALTTISGLLSRTIWFNPSSPQ